MEKAQVVAALIHESGLSRRAFAEKIGLPATTLQSMLSRGVGGASIDNVIKVCKGLNITIDQLEKMAEKIYGIGWAISEKRHTLGINPQEFRRLIGISAKELAHIELDDDAPISRYLAERLIVGGFGMSYLSFLDEYNLHEVVVQPHLDGGVDYYTSIKETVHKSDNLSESLTTEAQHDNNDWTEVELKIIDQFKEFLKSLRNKT